MADEEQIRALVIEYAELLDAGDLDGVAALFARGSFRSAGGGEPRVGSVAVRTVYDRVVLHVDGTPRTKHVLGNIEVACDPELGAATASCVFTVLQAETPGSLRPVLAGRYRDRFARDGDRWWFVERIVHPDLVGDLSAHMRPRG